MNPRGHPDTLVASHPENSNAVRHGAYSPRAIAPRAAEIEEELKGESELPPIEALAAGEAARCLAILEAIDRDLDERGIVDPRGKARSILDYRARISRQLEKWIQRLDGYDERASSEHLALDGEHENYVARLQRIALGHDRRAGLGEQLTALKQLLKLGTRGTTSGLKPRSEQSDWDKVAAAMSDNMTENLKRRYGIK